MAKNKEQTTPEKKKNGESSNRFKPSGFLSQKFRELFNAKPPEKISAADFRKEKKVLSDYQDIVKSEKGKRKKEDNSKALPAKADVPPPEKPGKADIPPVSGEHLKDQKSSEIKPPPRKTEKKEKEKMKFDTESIKKRLQETKDRWKAPKMIKTNLIKDEITTIVDWSKNLKILLPSMIVPVVIIILFYGGMIFWESKAKKEGEKLGGDIEVIYNRIQQTEKEVTSVDNFQKKLKLARNLLDDHIYWTDFFTFLEEAILTDAYILEGVSGKIDGKFQLPIRTLKYTNMGDQIRVFKENEYVEEITVGGGSLLAGKDDVEVGVVFKVDLMLNPSLFTR
jgi:hypothetical protein